jgi:hypothetical protein
MRVESATLSQSQKYGQRPIDFHHSVIIQMPDHVPHLVPRESLHFVHHDLAAPFQAVVPCGGF